MAIFEFQGVAQPEEAARRLFMGFDIRPRIPYNEKNQRHYEMFVLRLVEHHGFDLHILGRFGSRYVPLDDADPDVMINDDNESQLRRTTHWYVEFSKYKAVLPRRCDHFWRFTVEITSGKSEAFTLVYRVFRYAGEMWSAVNEGLPLPNRVDGQLWGPQGHPSPRVWSDGQAEALQQSFAFDKHDRADLLAIRESAAAAERENRRRAEKEKQLLRQSASTASRPVPSRPAVTNASTRLVGPVPSRSAVTKKRSSFLISSSRGGRRKKARTDPTSVPTDEAEPSVWEGSTVTSNATISDLDLTDTLEGKRLQSEVMEKAMHTLEQEFKGLEV